MKQLGATGQDMAANVIVGLALGYGAQWLFPGIKPWGLVGGLLFGAVSGFFQLFRREAMLRKQHEEEKKSR